MTLIEESVREQLNALENRIHSEEHPPLYHYTNAQGLLGILNSGKLWLSHVSYLNDATEFKYTYDLTNEIVKDKINHLEAELDKLESNSQVNRDHPLFIQRDLLYRLTYNHAGPKPYPDIYVACFCQDDDLLSQWRGYGNLERLTKRELQEPKADQACCQ